MDERRRVFEVSKEEHLFDFLVTAAQQFGTLDTVVVEKLTDKGFVHVAGYSVIETVIKTNNGFEEKKGTVPAKIEPTVKIKPATGY